MVTKLIRPVVEPHCVTSPYGWRVLWGKRQHHDGIDYISNRADRRVLSIADGVVVYDMDHYDDALKWTHPDHSAGNYVILRHTIHGVEYFVRYLHLAYNSVSAGEAVKQGRVLGEYSDAGQSTGPHLHIDMFTGAWKKINPTPILLTGLRANGLA